MWGKEGKGRDGFSDLAERPEDDIIKYLRPLTQICMTSMLAENSKDGP